MRQRLCGSVGASAFLALFLLISTLFVGAATCRAQTSQPFSFAETYDSAGNATGFVTLLRDSSTGALSIVYNSAVPFKDPCPPTAIDPAGHSLFGVCDEGLAMFTLDQTTGIVSELPNSPFAASTGPGGVWVAPDSIGQYVYLLKIVAPQGAQTTTLTFDTFAIDSATPSLVPANSQVLPFNESWAATTVDLNGHGIFILGNQNQGGTSPVGLLFSIPFDPSTGQASIPTNGLNIGNRGRTLAIGPTGGYLAIGWGDTTRSLTVYQLSSTDLTLALVASAILGVEQSPPGRYVYPDSIFFSPVGTLLYVQAPPPDFSGSGLPFLVYDPSNVTLLPTPAIQL